MLSIFLACALLGLISFLGVLTFSVKRKHVAKLSLWLVALSAGVLIGDAFIHLLPEANEVLEPVGVYSAVLAAYLLFFIIESVLQWHHCHVEADHDHHHQKPIGIMNLIGDGFHNFIDGLVIAASFLVDPALGWVTTLAVALHEIPQEFSDFGVLMHAGFTKHQALFFNFVVAMMSMLGAVIAIVMVGRVEGLVNWLLPFAAGGFIYIATSDLVPEIKRQRSLFNALLNVVIFTAGILIMYMLTYFE